MKPLVIYHKYCADGFGAAFAAWLKFGDDAIYLPIQYGTVKDWNSFRDILPENEFYVGKVEIYILDFSLPKEVMDTLFEVANRVVWLDHHKTAFEMWCGKYYLNVSSRYEADADDKGLILLDNNKSGAMIAWEYFHPEKEIPMLIKHIDDHDRRVFAIEGTKEFQKALWSYAPWSFEQWFTGLGLLTNYGVKQCYPEGTAILRAHEANVEAIVKVASRACFIPIVPGALTKDAIFYATEEQKLKGRAANCPPHLASDVGHQLANQSKTYGLLWYINKEGKCLCSLRSNGDYDVSAIAKAFGGGGHKNAAGFEIDIQTLLEWIK